VRDDVVRRAFADGVHWLTVGQRPDLLSLQATLHQAATNEMSAFRSVDEGRQALARIFAERACLLVLDDVWDADALRAFDVLGPAGRLLLTTRDGAVLTAVGAREERLERLPESAALQLLAGWAGEPADALPDAARAVAAECGYLALALAVAGARVRDGIAWQDVLTSLRENALGFLDHPYASVFGSLRLSVEALPTAERARYVELAVFPEDVAVPSSVVERLWAGTTGLPSHAARALLARLERKALLERAPDPAGESATGGAVTLHDLQHDYIGLAADDLPALHQALLKALAVGLPRAPDGVTPAWDALPADEPYPWLHLGAHLTAAGRGAEFDALRLDHRWLEAKLRATGLPSLLADFDNADGGTTTSDVAVVGAALRMAAHVLARDPGQLPSQLLGRLLGVDRPRVQLLLARMAPTTARAWLRPLTDSLLAPTSGLLRTFEAHGRAVRAVAIASDGRRAVTAAADGELRAWDLERGALLRAFDERAGGVRALGLAPVGRGHGRGRR
jgi:hypothetical protein